MADATYQPAVHRRQGGNKLVVASGGELDIESGGALKIAGTAISVSAAEMDQRCFTIYYADVTAAAEIFIVSPWAGTVSKIYSAIDAAITGNLAITGKIGGSAITNGAISVTASGSAAGDVDVATPTAANAITAGAAIELEFDGTPSGGVGVAVTLLIDL